MSKAAIDSLKGNFDYSWSLLQKFIEVCPEEVWAKKFGGWPIWQNVYHALVTVDFFVRQEGEKAVESMFSHEVGSLSEVATGPVPSREELRKLIPVMRDLAHKYFAKLSDADLGKKNEGLSSRMPMPWTHASTCAMLSAHTMYHLGICDAALREKGLQGVF